MKASELRIGNYVTHNDYSNTAFMVFSIIKNNYDYIINTIGGKNGTWINNIELIEPIQLTEEWLVKFGFGKIKNIYCCTDGFANSLKSRLKYVYPELCIYKTNNKTYTVSIGRNWLDRKFEVYQILKTVKYVHQLQNLYFALTGNELTIK